MSKASQLGEGNPTCGIYLSTEGTGQPIRQFNDENNEMTIASDLLQQHIQTLVDDNTRWQTLIADDILWELAYAPSLGHPA